MRLGSALLYSGNHEAFDFEVCNMIKKLLCVRTDILVLFWFLGGYLIVFYAIAESQMHGAVKVAFAISYFLIPALFNEWREKFCKECQQGSTTMPSTVEPSFSTSSSDTKPASNDKSKRVLKSLSGNKPAIFEVVSAPDFGGVLSGKIIEVHVHEGDTIGKDSELIVVEFDKCIMPIPSPLEGVVDKVYVEVGETISRGVPICLINSKESSQQANE